MSSQAELWPLLLFLAGTVGFVADRSSICNVKAVEEVLTTRCAYMLGSFAKTVLWVTGITILIVWLFEVTEPRHHSFVLGWPSLLGGLLFGFGAVLNGGCALSTLTRLGNGNVGMIVALAGFVAGVVTYQLIGVPAMSLSHARTAPWLDLNMNSARVLSLVICIWLLWESGRLLRTTPNMPVRKRILASAYRLSTAAAIIGLCNGILFALLGTWAYTHTLRRAAASFVDPASATPGLTSLSLLGWLFFALVVGVIASAVHQRRFSLAWKPRLRWLGYTTGGFLMGIGAALVPGGNDVLLLNSIPGFSPHALPAYIAMLAGIFFALIVYRSCGGQWLVVDCHGDFCRVIKRDHVAR